MPKVDTIEVPQGNDWVHQLPRQAIDAENRFHVNSPRRCVFSTKLLDFTTKGYKIKCCRFQLICAEVAELADALDSGSSARKGVGVQIPPSAPQMTRGLAYPELNRINEKVLQLACPVGPAS